MAEQYQQISLQKSAAAMPMASLAFSGSRALPSAYHKGAMAATSIYSRSDQWSDEQQKIPVGICNLCRRSLSPIAVAMGERLMALKVKEGEKCNPSKSARAKGTRPRGSSRKGKQRKLGESPRQERERPSEAARPTSQGAERVQLAIRVWPWERAELHRRAIDADTDVQVLVYRALLAQGLLSTPSPEYARAGGRQRPAGETTRQYRSSPQNFGCCNGTVEVTRILAGMVASLITS